jgi:UDP-2,4-diacetamido-2,4,6-trideoxy-beta-L-altropyranose hydrolase
MRLGTLLVRADASLQIGTGHVMRCLALAQAWKEQGGTAIFLMADASAAFGERLASEGIGEVHLSTRPASHADAEETAAVALRHNAAWVALDGYQFPPEYQRRLKNKTAHLLLFDDLAKSDSYHADLLLNQNAYAIPEMYGNRAGNCTLLLGAAYFLLRREFADWRLRDRKIAARGQNLLVTFGGSDPENATALALQALALLPSPAMNVKVLVGSSNPNRAGLEKLAAKMSHSVEFQTDTKQIAAEMAWADLAISAAGSTSWELAFMGLPSLLITLSQNQEGCAQYLDRHGIALSLGSQHEAQPAKIAAALKDLSTGAGRRAEMSSRGRKLIDGQGASRIIEAMVGIASQPTHGDAPLMSREKNG